jgi:hypothetical protein
MTKFKIRDKVREISTGDEGVIESVNSLGDFKVKWKTGSSPGMILTIGESYIEHASEVTFEQAMQTLLQLGYKVTLEKI